MLGEEDEAQSIDLMKILEISFQHKQRMLEASKGTEESHVFKTDDLCMFVGCKGHGDRKPLKFVLEEDLPHEGMRERQIMNFFMSEEGTTLSLESCERGSYACSKDAYDVEAMKMNIWI